MGIFAKRSRKKASTKITSIRLSVLETIAEAAKDTYPREFAGGLRASGGTINEVILIPGTVSGDVHAILHLYNIPSNFSVVGSVHSHPSPSPFPSDADLQLFRTFGRVHIIMAYPYNLGSWRAYSSSGEERELEMV
ncbi:MAG: Mov34/MPN/PAD-1 family protein [Candidatus Thermoplasmatota archaeon]|nr:Mov34/MPN/PAD-1 family protein [Candidatus Thermoplasmatota archaeon]